MHPCLRRLSVVVFSTARLSATQLTLNENQPPTASLYLSTCMTAFPPYPLSPPALIHRPKLLLILIIIFFLLVMHSIVPSSGMQIDLVLYQRSLGQFFRLDKRDRCIFPSILLSLFHIYQFSKKKNSCENTNLHVVSIFSMHLSQPPPHPHSSHPRSSPTTPPHLLPTLPTHRPSHSDSSAPALSSLHAVAPASPGGGTAISGTQARAGE